MDTTHETQAPAAPGGIRQVIRDKPWLLIVALLGGFVALDIVFLTIALANPPQMSQPATPPAASVPADR